MGVDLYPPQTFSITMAFSRRARCTSATISLNPKVLSISSLVFIPWPMNFKILRLFRSCNTSPINLWPSVVSYHFLSSPGADGLRRAGPPARPSWKIHQRARNLEIFELLSADLLDIGLPDLCCLGLEDYAHSSGDINTGNLEVISAIYQSLTSCFVLKNLELCHKI